MGKDCNAYNGFAAYPAPNGEFYIEIISMGAFLRANLAIFNPIL
jgi:hypothetical protein